jgi:predicted metal-binding membrane protein
MTGPATLRWRHAPLAVPSLLAWVMLVSWSVIPTLPDLCGPEGHFWTTVPASFEIALRINPLPPLLLSWLMMLCAMMLPLLHAPLSHLRANNGARAVPAFLIGYAAVWMAAIMVLVALTAVLRLATISSVLAGPLIALGVAAAWQTTGIKRRCLSRCCDRPSFRPGAAARQGVAVAGACVGSCWALMALPFMFAGVAHFMVMAAVALLMLHGRYRQPMAARPDLRAQTLALAVAAISAGLLSL